MLVNSPSKPKQTAIYYLCLIGFFGIFSTTISKNPVLPLFVKGLGADISLLGVLSSLSPLAGILFSFPVGYLADVWGKKRLLLISAAIFTTAPLLYLFVFNPWLLVPIRFFHGLATAILGPIAASILVSVYSEKKGESLGLYSSATLVGRMLAPLVGGFIIASFATLGNLTNFKLVYLAAFLLALPLLFITLKLDYEPEIESKVKSGMDIKGLLLTLKNFQSHRMIFLTSLVEMATYFIYGVYETYLPLYLISQHISATKIGLIFSLQVLSIAATKPFFGKLADKIDKRVQITFGIFILTLAMSLITLVNNFYVLVVIGLLFGLGISFGTVATSAYVADLSKKSELGSFMGALSSMMDIGQTSGPFIMGFVISLFSIKIGFLLSAGLAAVLVGIIFTSSYLSQKHQL